MKLKYTVVYDNSSDKFGIGHGWINVKVTVGLQKFSPYSATRTNSQVL